MGLRRKARELALQALYLTDVAKSEPEKAFAGVCYGQTINDKTRDFVWKLLTGTLEHRAHLDELIVQVSANWEIQRMAALDRNILRLGAYEILYEVDTPISVVIDEAVEIAKLFSTDDSGKFVNGILDKIKRERQDEPNGKKDAD